MLNYKTCKSLKEVGFPLRKVDDYTPTLFIKMVIRLNGQWYFIPSLSELIEACGDKFESLERIEDEYWQAYMTRKAFDKSGIECVYECCGYGSGETMEEAVADLYLALKSKR